MAAIEGCMLLVNALVHYCARVQFLQHALSCLGEVSTFQQEVIIFVY